MAYYEQDDDEQQADPDAPVPVGPSEPSTISGQGSAGANAGPANAAEAPSGGSSGSPGQFVGIKQYLDANKAQTTGLARDVSGYVSDLGNQARSQLESGQNSFNQDVERNTIGLNQGLFDEAKGDPNSVAQDQAKLQEFKKQRDAAYQGPSSFEQSDYFQPINQAIQKATTAGANTATEAGQKDLLARIQQAKKGKVNQGALAFDASLLQSDPNSRNILAETRKGLEDIPQKLSAAEQAALEKVSGAKQTTDATKAAIQGAFSGDTGLQSLLQKDVEGRAQNAIGQSKEQADQTMQLLKSGGEPSDAQLDILDISRDQWNQLVGNRSYLQSTYGVNPYADFSTYGTVKNPETQINSQNIATADDYARYAALNQLMDTQNNFLSDPSQAGTADLDSLDFNYSGLSGDLQNSIQLEKKAREMGGGAHVEYNGGRSALEGAAMGAAAGTAVAGPIGTIVGGVIGAIGVCFLHNTPILMANGSYKMIQDLVIGEYVAYGGMVMGHGKSLCLRVVEYKGRFTSDQHALFDGQKYVRACDVMGGSAHDLDTPVVVYPVVTENHILITDNGVVYADLIEVDAPGASDKMKLRLLNKKNHIHLARCIEKEISWTLLDTNHSTMLN